MSIRTGGGKTKRASYIVFGLLKSLSHVKKSCKLVFEMACVVL